MITIDELKKEMLQQDTLSYKNFLQDFDIKQCDNYGNNLLHYYIKSHKSFKHEAEDLIPILLEKGIDINAAQSKGDQRNPLMMAVIVKSLKIVKLLLQHNADLNIQDKYGNTALGISVIMYRSEKDAAVLQCLLKNGADPDLKNNAGISPRIVAGRTVNHKISTFFENY